MPKDQRLYGKFTLDFADHPKIAILSDTAFRCLVEATLWSRKQERDGLLPRRYAVAKWSLDVLQELCCNDDTKPSLIERDEGWYVHDFAEHQETKADIEARRERNRAAGQKGGLAKAKRSAKRGAKQPISEVVSENVAEKEEEEHNSTTDKSVVERPRQRGTRLSPDWMPARSVIDEIKAECPHVDLEAEHRKFVDYWTDKTGKDATKISWEGTWRNWVRRAESQTPQGRPSDPRNVHKLRAITQLAADVRAQEQQAELVNQRRAVE